MCRVGRAALRMATFVLGGVAVAFGVSWLVSAIPVLGYVLAVVAVVLLLRALLLVFTRPSPLVAAAHLAGSVVLGLGVALVLGAVLG